MFSLENDDFPKLNVTIQKKTLGLFFYHDWF